MEQVNNKTTKKKQADKMYFFNESFNNISKFKASSTSKKIIFVEGSFFIKKYIIAFFRSRKK